MASFLGSFKQAFSHSYLGIDIGTTSIKAVEVKRGRAQPEIINYGILESRSYLIHANRFLQSSNLKIFDAEAVELVKMLLSKMGTQTTEAVATLPAFSVFMTLISMPAMEPKDLGKAVVFQAKQYVPLPLSEVALDWSKVGEFADERGNQMQEILLISVPQEHIAKYKAIFKNAGLRLKALEIENFGVVRSLVGRDPTPTVVVDVGGRSTGISFAQDGVLTYGVQSDYASSSLTQAVAASLNINPLRAEDLKRERGIIASGVNLELSTIMIPFLDVIIGEVKKAQFRFFEQFPKARKIGRVLLAGAGANLLGIERYLGDQLQLPVAKGSPFVGFAHPASVDPLVPELNPVFAVALGAVLRELA